MLMNPFSHLLLSHINQSETSFEEEEDSILRLVSLLFAVLVIVRFFYPGYGL